MPPSDADVAALKKLLGCASHLGVDACFKACEIALVGAIRPETAATLFEAADATGAPRLKKAAVTYYLKRAATPAGIMALQCVSPRLFKELEDDIASAVNKDNVSALTALAQRFDSATLQGACLGYSLEDRRALKSDEFRRIAANTSLGIEMLKRIADTQASAQQRD